MSLIKKNIPNAVTCCNLICGCIATGAAFHGFLKTALLFIILGAVFDFFDGMTARALKVSSPIGKELDSLADCVTFGVAPSSMLFTVMTKVQYPSFMAADVWGTFLPYIAFIMAALSAVRLAKFNLDERQTTSFIGLPTPANALFWGALIVGSEAFLESVHFNILFLIALELIFSYALVAEIPMFSLKVKNLGWADNKVRYIFIIVSIPLLILLGISGIAAVIAWYIILSLVVARQA